MSENKPAGADAINWFNNREWANGLTFKAHGSTDILEFFIQYTKNKSLWDKAFTFLRETRLESLAPGKYPLEGENVYVSVSEDNIKDFEDTRWEAHRRYIDIQYVTRGREKMGVAPFPKAVADEPFSEDKDLGFYTVPETEGQYYVAEPGTFFVFFPKDAHRPGIKIPGTDAVKKIVIKIKAG